MKIFKNLSISFPQSRPKFKKTYRVTEIKMGSGESVFYPQVRKLWVFWIPMFDEDFTSQPKRFITLERANQYLYDQERAVLAKKIVAVKEHGFDAVFYKLRQNAKSDGSTDSRDTGGFV